MPIYKSYPEMKTDESMLALPAPVKKKGEGHELGDRRLSINSHLIRKLTRRGRSTGFGLPQYLIEQIWKDEFGILGDNHPEELKDNIIKRLSKPPDAALMHSNTKKISKK